MPITVKTRKPVVELTQHDFDVFPIWEYATDEERKDGQDETWVRPVKQNFVPNGAYSQLVSTRFTTPAGTPVRGFMVVTTASALVDIMPGAVMAHGVYAVLPSLTRAEAISEDAPWQIEFREKLIRTLCVPEEAFFPLAYSLDVFIGRERKKRKGVIR